jgi:hypothetical protein
MLPEAEGVLARVLDVHSGDPWHGSSTTRLLIGISDRQAISRPAADVHSIWEIVLHMTAWTREVASRLAGAAAKDPDAGDWPEAGPATDESWRAAVTALDAAQQELKAAAEATADARWHASVGDAREASAGTGGSHLDMLEGLALHHAYHAGQLALLKKWVQPIGR